MGHRAKLSADKQKHTYDKLAPTSLTKNLKTLGKLLYFVGQPLFIFISYILVIIASAAFFTAQLINKDTKPLLKKSTTLLKKKINEAKRLQEIRKNYEVPLKGIIFDAKENGKNATLYFRDEILPYVKFFLWLLKILVILVFKAFSELIKYSPRIITPLKNKFHFIRKSSSKFLQIYAIKYKSKFNNIPRLKLISFVLIFFFSIGFILAVIFWIFILKDLPSPEDLSQRRSLVSTKIHDRNGVPLYNIYKDQNRTPVALANVPVNIKLATIAIEDAEFYNHSGFSLRGIVRAIIRNLKRHELTGGSTITQQLVKNTLLTPEKTFIRKSKEIILAIRVELKYSKDKILEMYLNEVSYGGTAYGIQTAAQTYFGKDAKDLNLAEAALLAGLPKSPTLYSPFGANPEKAKERQKEVLNLMRINGFITEEQEIEAENGEIKYAENHTSIKAPHFVFYVREILEENYGRNLVESGGLQVQTTLDFDIQTLAERVINEELEKLKSLNVTNAAAVVLDPRTGEVLAMVGSKDYFSLEDDGNVNVALRPRQPGSSIKVVNYAYALSNGFTAATMLNDSPYTFNVTGQEPYTPKNYEGDYRGNISLRSALAESRNIPAVKTLAIFGVDKMIDMGQKMGITTWEDPKNYGLSLTLGGGEVKLLDLAKVYATLADYGKRPELNSILKISDYSGRVVEEFKCKENEVDQVNLVNQVAATESAFNSKSYITKDCGGVQILDPRVAFIITDILKDNDARSPSFGTNSLLTIPKHKEVAVKTGTSNDLRDNLAIGYTQNYVVAVWVGNNNNSPMARISSGVTGATPIWNKIMSALLAQEENHDWSVPSGLEQIPICPYTGTLACNGCPNKMEWFFTENKPITSCSEDWFKENKDDQKEEKPKKRFRNQFLDSILNNRFNLSNPR